MVTRTVMWFRRDLRLGDHPALAEAATTGEVLPLFVVDPQLWGTAGVPRRDHLRRSLQALDEAIDGALVVRAGNPEQAVAEVAREVGATSVYVSADFGPYGSTRDRRVEQVLAAAGVTLQRTGSPYAVSPGRVRKPDGSPYRVYSPFYRAWCSHGWRPPAVVPPISWATGVDGEPLPGVPRDRSGPDRSALPAAGEDAALARWRTFVDEGLDGYAEARDRPDLDATSRLSVYLKYGELHPRTLLAELGPSDEKLTKGREVFRKELAWREFYADVLHHEPRTAVDYYRQEFAGLPYDEGPGADERLAAWQQGETGYPMVDAGMRQLLTEGWMHNRVRMIVASFLVKDLHIEWQHGARWFMQHLVDGDLASNAHGWQWTAGCGTDAAPYFRIFNPVTQGLRYDPDGDYVRRYVPELAHLKGAAAHEPWVRPDGYTCGYPQRIVDHASERLEALARYGHLTKAESM
jgi:deoxyribodipyrimidine photo-lyase